MPEVKDAKDVAIGITVEELMEILPTWLGEVLNEYEDDHKLTVKETFWLLSELCVKLGEVADAPYSRYFKIAAKILDYFGDPD